MPDIRIKDPESGMEMNMPWGGVDNPTSADIDYFLKQKKGSNNPGINVDTLKTYGKRFLFGPESDPGQVHSQALKEEQAKAGFDPDKLKGRVIGTPESEGSILPKFKQPESYAGGFANSLYNDFVRALGTPSGVLGNSQPKPIPRIDPVKVQQQLAATKAARDLVIPPKQPIGLPPAPPEPRFYSGPAGVAESGRTYPTDIGPIKPYPGQQGAGTILPRETEDITGLPPIDAARLGTTRGDIPTFKYDSPSDIVGSMEAMKEGNPMQGVIQPDKKGRVTVPNNTTPEPSIYERKPAGDDFSVGELPKDNARKYGSTLAEYKGGGKPEPSSNVNTNDIGRVGLPEDEAFRMANEDPRNWGSGTPTKEAINVRENKSSLRTTLDDSKSKPNTIASAEAAGAEAHARLESKGIGTSNYTPYRPIPNEAPVKDAIKQWADGTVSGAKVRGQFAADKFRDLSDPSLIDKFETGDRTGRLKDLATYFETRWQQAKELGILGVDQKRLNYIRHYFEQSPEEVGTALKTYVAKNPKFAKEGKFPTYASAAESGITPKYKTIPEIVEAYETEFHRAVKNKELYDYMKSSGRLAKGALSDDIKNWQLKGPDADKAIQLIKNVMSKSEGILGAAADASSMAKNIYLAGGVPYTKYNMHAWNILRNDIANSGPVSALSKFFRDPTGNKAVEWYKSLHASEKDILADLSDRGWQGKPVSDIGETVNLPGKLAEKIENPAGKAVLEGASKVVEGSQKVFERPLFDKALPALNAQRALEAFHSLEKQGMAREDALKAAAQIGNDFYGGVDKVLRSSTNRDLGRVAILAPDWLESQVTKAYHQWKGAAKTVVGKGTPVDKHYAASLAKSAMIPAIGPIAAIGAGKAILGHGKQRDIGAIPLGEVNGKTREFPTLTTANEELRTPIVAPIEMYRGNPAALKDILVKNRISTTANTLIDMVRGEDRYGNPLSGADKYGKKISFGKAAANYATEATRPFQHQVLQGLISWLKGDISAEEAAAMGLELPLAYSSPGKEKKQSISGPRISLPKTMR
jgi:hypothetical protein